MNEPKRCAHCGLELKQSSQSDFCCMGCETVYAILQKSHMGNYYLLKENAPEIRPARPIKAGEKNYDYLDSPEVASLYLKDEGQTAVFYLEGIHCIACLWLVENIGSLVEGVQTARLNLGNSQVRITKSKEATFSTIATTLHQLGYTPHPISADDDADLLKKELRRSLLRIGVAAACTMNIMLFSVGLYVGADGIYASLFRWASGVFIIPVVTTCSMPFYKGLKSAF
jgi:hypothetical protein